VTPKKVVHFRVKPVLETESAYKCLVTVTATALYVYMPFLPLLIHCAHDAFHTYIFLYKLAGMDQLKIGMGCGKYNCCYGNEITQT
jgi:hypothetical protein